MNRIHRTNTLRSGPISTRVLSHLPDLLLLGLQYEPEIFPGLIYRMKQPKVVLLIFVSGKVVLTGGLSGLPSCRSLCEAYLLRAF